MDTATFGAGCFWGVEETFRVIKGVTEIKVGYTGGDFKNPTYEDVCTGVTGHAEVVQIEFDPEIVSYEALLNIFWNNHNPTTLNKQGFDVGTQYRSIIFYHNEEQKEIAEKSRDEFDKSDKHQNPVVTIIEPFKNFFLAEDYHQKYLQKRGLGSCEI